MKVLNKIKSIYLLTIIAILSFCMLLFPAMPKTANAEGAEMGSGTFAIKSFQVVVQTYDYYMDEEGNKVECEPYDKWANMFKAEITKEQYNTITQKGKVNVKFGVLIGRTSRTEGIEEKTIAEITGPKKDGGLAFEVISYVGLGLGAQQIEFAEGETTFGFEAGIIYNEKTNLPEGKTLIDMASYDLTAIPFYMNGKTVEESTEIEILFDAKKNVVPKDVLVNSYAYQQIENNGAPYEEGAVPISEHTMKTFAGEIDFFEGDAYVCRSTNRLMVEGEDGTLAPADIDAVAYYNKRIDITAGVDGKADTLDSNFVGGLEKNGKGCVISYSANNQVTVYYGVKTAERVITRFANTTIGIDQTNYTDDYLAVAGTDKYTSIFAVNNDVENLYLATGAGAVSETATNTYEDTAVYVSIDKGYDGLYVLANGITFSSDDYQYVVYTGEKTFSSRITAANATYAKPSYVAPIYGLGFKGTFDGRGFFVDADSKANQGIFPSSFDATVKNTAFLNLTQTSEGGGIMAHAKASRFENIYATVASVTNFTADLNKGILMNVENCDFVNFVAYVDIANTAAATAKFPGSNIAGTIANGAGTTGYGQGQGVGFGGVFSFRAYPDMYYDEEISGVRYMSGNAVSDTQFVNEIANDIGGMSEVERLFPSGVIVKNDGAESLSRYAFNNGLTNVANPSPFTNSDSYDGTGPNDDQVRKYASDLHTAFVGTTGVNVYTIGSSPLYMAQHVVDVYNKTTNGVTTRGVAINGSTENYDTTTVFVNQAPTLVAGGNADMNWKVVDGVATAPTAYTWNEIDGNMFEIAFTDADGNALTGTALNNVKKDAIHSLGELIIFAKSYISGATATKKLTGTTTSGTNIANILANGGTTAQEKLKVQFVNQAGFYDCATAADMASYVNANAENTEMFENAGFWNVVDGVVTWKNLPAQA